MMNEALYVRHWGSTTDEVETISSDTAELRQVRCQSDSKAGDITGSHRPESQRLGKEGTAGYVHRNCEIRYEVRLMIDEEGALAL